MISSSKTSTAVVLKLWPYGLDAAHEAMSPGPQLPTGPEIWQNGSGGSIKHHSPAAKILDSGGALQAG